MRRIRVLVASLGFAAVMLLPNVAAADVNDFTITSFKSDQTLTRKDKQGELRIVERINVEFTDQNHGLLRAIPKSYKNHSLQIHMNKISSDTGAPTEYSTYDSNGNKVFKIGDPDKTVTGAQQYTIDYTVRNVITFYDAFDELYWDVNGDQWPQPFGKVEATIHLPKGLVQSKQPVCYTGSYGSTTRNCNITTQGDTVTVLTTEPLSGYQGLTYALAFKKGYFQPSTWYETTGEYSPLIIGIVVPTAMIGGMALMAWWRRGRDSKSRGVIVPQYNAPDNLSPLQVDGLNDFNVGNVGITATIVDLAIRGHLQIIETKQAKRLRKDTVNYSLKLTDKDFSDLDEDELKIIGDVFTQQTPNETINITEHKNKLYSTATYIRTHVKQWLKDNDYLRSKVPGANRRLAQKIVVALIVLLAVFVYSGWFTLIGIGIGVTIAVICWMAMDARTEKGVAAKEHIEGLKLYLNVAEKERINKLQSPNAKYAEKTNEPQKTVQLFEKLLPYAIVLGVENQWAKQFETLYTTPPNWYSGNNWRTFNAVYLTSHLNEGIGSAVNTAFSSPSSSGSSGSGGGGFSGGGGGGGGGGGW